MTAHEEDRKSSVQYHCSEIFSGELNIIPGHGIDKMNGWNTFFYHLDNGTPRAISSAPRLNPFTYNVTGLVNSLDMSSLRNFGDSQSIDGSLVVAGNDLIGFALSCSSTIYNVNHAIVRGNISYFNARSGQRTPLVYTRRYPHN